MQRTLLLKLSKITSETYYKYKFKIFQYVKFI